MIDTETVIEKSKQLSEETIKPPTTPGNCFDPKLKWIYDSKIAVEIKGIKTRKSNFYS